MSERTEGTGPSGRDEAETTENAVWRALANPLRRALLDRLVEGPLTTGQLAASVPSLSRFAVMQHLEVLTGAGLVLVRREGRTRLNYLNAVPVQEVCERWVSGLAGTTARAATAFRRHVESQMVTPTEPKPDAEPKSDAQPKADAQPIKGDTES